MLARPVLEDTKARQHKPAAFLHPKSSKAALSKRYPSGVLTGSCIRAPRIKRSGDVSNSRSKGRRVIAGLDNFKQTIYCCSDCRHDANTTTL